MGKLYTSPPGIAFYPHLNTPDTRYDADGVMHVKLEMDSEDEQVAKYLEWIDKLHDESVAEAIESLINPEGGKKGITEAAARKRVKDGDKPYVYVEDEDGEPTNIVRVNFKMKAKVTSKRTGKTYNLRPTIFNAKRDKLENPPLIYGGSVLRISFEPKKWFTPKLGASVRLQLEAVQIKELVTSGGNRSADDYGFDEEDGYSDVPDATPFDDDSSAGSTADADDGDDDGTGDF